MSSSAKTLSKPLRIAAAQGFWGDWPQAPLLQARRGPVDVLVLDYLAEVTMSILQKQRKKDPNQGYARDFVDTVGELAKDLASNPNLTIISNAGGVNPVGCAKALRAKLDAAGLTSDKIKVGVIHGDDIMDRLDDPALDMIALDKEGPSLSQIRGKLVSANVYFGAWPVVKALQQGCRVIVTGRVTDTGLTLAPMANVLGLAKDDWDSIATGIVAGHILECGGQASGGNCLARRLDVSELVELGYPIVEVTKPGEFVVTKHETLGGEVSVASVTEQLLYEIGNPADYITPDVIADFGSIKLESLGPNRVRVHGIKGSPATDRFKVSCAYSDGSTLVGTMTYTWPDAMGKAKAAGQLVLERAAKLGMSFDAVRVETVGANACHGPVSSCGAPGEVTLRISARSQSAEALDRLGRDVIPLVLTGPPGATGFAGGRPRPSDVVAYWPGLILKTAATPVVDVF